MALMQRLEMRQGQSLVMTPQLLQAIKLLQLSHLDLAAYVEAELERNPLLERPEPEAEERSAPDDEGRDPPGAGESWLADDLDPGRSELGRETDAGLDNVFSAEAPVAARHSGAEGDVAPLVASPWTGGSGFDGDGSNFEATLTSEVGLAEHLERQLDLALHGAQERLVGRHLIDGIDEAGYLSEPAEAFAERLGAPLEQVERILAVIQGFDPPGIGARTLAECLEIQLRERNRFDPAMQALISRLALRGG
jgi:RNA polymerase sigma-54 factor